MQTAASSNASENLSGPLADIGFASSSVIEELIVMAPPRMHYAPLGPGIQQSTNGDLAILSFDAIDDYLPLGTTDITFTLSNAGVAAADSFVVDVLYSDDDILGNSDDVVIDTINIAYIGAQDTLTRTVNVQIPQSILYERSRLETPGAKGAGTISGGMDYLGIRVDTQNRVIETDETNNVSQVKGIGLDDVSYFPWDVDGNEQVEVTDEIFVTDNIGQSVDSTNAQADFDGDGEITAEEASDVQDRIGYSANPVVATPTITIDVEPATPVNEIPVLSGFITEAATINTLKAGFNDALPEDYIDISEALQPIGPADAATTAQTTVQTTGSFTIEAATLNEVYGGELPDGDYTLNLATTDTTGTSTATSQQTFTLDTQRPTYTPLIDSNATESFSSFEVDFSEAVDDSATSASNYTLASASGGAVEILSVERLSDQQVGLTLAAELPAAQYEFAVGAVSDLAGNTIAEAAPFTFQVGEVHTDCLPDDSVLTQGGSYSTDLGLTASLALPGNQGVDVVMTAGGAIAAVNNDAGSSLYWIDPATGAIAQTVNLESGIRDIAFDGDDTLVAAIEGKVVKLSAQSGNILSEIELPGIGRAAISKNGHIAAISGKMAYLYDTDGSVLFSKFLNYVGVTDIEVRSCGDGNDLVYVTSFRNDSFTFLGNTNPVQIARLEAFDFSGDRQWQLFGDPSETIKQNVADTRLYRTTLGQDGYLYIGGESAGTATIFRWRGQPMTEGEQFGSASPFLSRIDANSQLYNSASAHISYYARVNPITGQLVHSQLTFPRLSSGKSNTMRIGDIAGGTNGTLYFGGAANASLRNRSSQTINGQPIGNYSGQDTTWMAIAPNFGNRNFWTALSEESGKGKVNGVDAGYGYSAAVSNVLSGTIPVTTGSTESNVYISFIAE